MIILGLDTSTIIGSWGLIDTNKKDILISEYNLNLPKKTHSERLLPALKEMLIRCNITLEQIEGLAVSIGPGSFTGLRIGVMSIKTMAYALNIPLSGVSTLEALAYQVKSYSGRICAIIDARMQEVYMASYYSNGKELKELTSPIVRPLEDILIEMKENNESSIFVGNANQIYREMIISYLGDKAIFPAPLVIYPRGSIIAYLGAMKIIDGKEDNVLKLIPNYIRRSQAEINWEKKK